MSEVIDYTCVPEGTYLCKVEEVRLGTTRAGDQRAAIKLVVAEGEYEGRLAAWDALVFSARGASRAQRIYRALGVDAARPTDALVGCRAFVQVRPCEFESPDGDVIRRNEVPYDGYSSR